ncbi:hypothetical protein [Halosimplex salinum]|uniref:hypothetical protein n=1 Tax=Halosimplex salinum TaxID=1710538 RepID=UPI0019D22C7D|nr:hypothetical protein [Halosimplex salinum]
MSEHDSGADSDDAPSGARMMLDPDTIHERPGELALDCPACGSTASIQQIVEEGHCSGYVEDDEMDAQGGDQVRSGGCTAELSLELVWED